ncbi:MAG TPA: dihydropteroate synthase [Amnibacterium sp.]|nr:dihydropteroate synthase [Amnibacterium sp.]
MTPTRPVLFGVVNTTPDSFSDGGRYLDAGAAIAHGRALAADGADLVDIGGESTRPGAEPVTEAEELRRTIPVVAALAADGVRVSIDTRSARVAAEALAAGAVVVNDVSGGTADPRMLTTVAGSVADVVLMHSRGAAASPPRYTDVIGEVRAELGARVAAARAAGIPDDRLVLDPGIGFAKGAAENWALLAHLDALRIDGIRLLVGVSRKRFLAALAPEGAPAEARDLPTAVLSALLAEQGVWGLRVHDVAGTRAALDVVARMAAA